MSKILAFYSGGLDSTGMLYKLFSEAQYREHELHIHFIELRNRENRWKAEKAAVENCLRWLSENYKDRSYTFTSNILDFSFLKRVTPLDYHSVAFVTAQIISENPNYDYVAIGMNKTDKIRLGNFPRVPSIVRCVLGNSARFPTKIYPVIDLYKDEIWDVLPVDLREKTWSCREPLYNMDKAQSCGKCYTCLDLPQRKKYELHINEE